MIAHGDGGLVGAGRTARRLSHRVEADAAHLLILFPPAMTTEVAEAIHQRVFHTFVKISHEETAVHDVQQSMPTTSGGRGLKRAEWPDWSRP